MTEKKRLANVELLRCLAMIMIIVMHFLSHSGRLIELNYFPNVEKVLGSLLESFCLAAVNVYVFISGYYGSGSTFKPSRVISFLGQIWFYALLIPAILTPLGFSTIAKEKGIYGLIQYLFPIETEHYWFATSFFILFLLTPLINRGIKGLSRKQFKIMLTFLLILFCAIKSISPVVFAFDRYGYDLPWFICVYLLAAYLKLYGNSFLEKRGFLIYIGSALASFAINLGMLFLSEISNSFNYYFTVPYHYNFIFCLTGALGLFYGFSHIKLREGKAADVIRRLGGLSFGVYLLHEHIDVRYQWYGWCKNLINPSGASGIVFFLIELILCIVIVFVLGIAIDYVRSILFKAIGRGMTVTKLGKWIAGLDNCFSEGSKIDEK